MTFSEEAEAVLQDRDTLRRMLMQSLEADPRPLYRWKRQQRAKGTAAEYDLHVDGLVARCRFEAEDDGPVSVLVTALTPAAEHKGYPRY